MNDHEYVYIDAFDSYCKHDFKKFERIINNINSNRELFYMIFLGVSMSSYYKSSYCRKYMIERFDFTDAQVALCLLNKFEHMDKIYDKINVRPIMIYENSQQTYEMEHYHLVTMLRLADPIKFDILQKSMADHGSFNGKQADMDKINFWLKLIEGMQKIIKTRRIGFRGNSDILMLNQNLKNVTMIKKTISNKSKSPNQTGKIIENATILEDSLRELIESFYV